MRRGPSADSAFVQQEGEIGTEKYRAPEMVINSHFNKKADIWAMGCILYQILAYRPLFPTDYDVAVYSAENPGAVPQKLIPLDSFVDMGSVDWRVRGPIPTTVSQMFATVPDQRPEAGELIDAVFKPLVKAGVGPKIHVVK
jgi:serine/threonine protein kinase